MELEQGGGKGDLALGLDQRFALFERRDLRQMLGPLTQDRGGAVEHLRALRRVDLAPRLEPAIGGIERTVEIVGGRERQRGLRLAGRGIEHVVRVTPGAVQPFASDIKAEARVVGGHAGLLELVTPI